MPTSRGFEVRRDVACSRHQLSPNAKQPLFGAGSKVRAESKTRLYPGEQGGEGEPPRSHEASASGRQLLGAHT
jgi:hypothetical protein